MNTKVIHVSDIHLNHDYATILNQFNKEVVLERYNFMGFQNFLDTLEFKNIDFVLVTGDVFDFESVGIAEIDELLEVLQNYSELRFVMAPALKDLTADSWFNIIEWPSNVNILRNDACFIYEEKQVMFYRGMIDESLRLKPLLKLQVTDLPMQEVENRVDVQYTALMNEPDYVQGEKMACPGSFEPSAFSEKQKNGYIEIEMDATQTKIQFVERNSLKLIRKNLNLQPEYSLEEIIQLTRDCVGDQAVHVYYEIIYTGNVNKSLRGNFLVKVKQQLSNEFKATWKDLTNKDYYLKEIESQNKDNLIGIFINSIENKEIKKQDKQDIIESGLDYLL